MKDLNAIAERILDSNEKDTEAMKELCRAAGMEQELEKYPDDHEWLWEVTWNAAEKLGVSIDEPFFHFFDSFRVDLRSNEKFLIHGVERYSAFPACLTEDYWEAKKQFALQTRGMDGVRDVGRIVGILRAQEPWQTPSEEVIKTNEPVQTWTELGEYRDNLQAEKEMLLYRITQIDRQLEETFHAKN